MARLPSQRGSPLQWPPSREAAAVAAAKAMGMGEEEEEDDGEGGSMEELMSADAVCLETCSSSTAEEQCLPNRGSLCSVTIEGAIAPFRLLDCCVMVQVPTGDVIITRDYRGQKRGFATVFNSQLFPF